jgi:hypothetical protein
LLRVPLNGRKVFYKPFTTKINLCAFYSGHPEEIQIENREKLTAKLGNSAIADWKHYESHLIAQKEVATTPQEAAQTPSPASFLESMLVGVRQYTQANNTNTSRQPSTQKKNLAKGGRVSIHECLVFVFLCF